MWYYGIVLTEPVLNAQQTQQSQVIEVVWDDPVARYLLMIIIC